MRKFTRKRFGHYRIQFCLPNNIILLVMIDKLDPNPVLVNVNKLKPFQLLEDEVQSIGYPTPLNWERQGDDSIENKKVDSDEEVVPIMLTQMFVV